MDRVHILVVSKTHWKYPNHSIPLFRDFGKASDLVERLKNVFIGWPLHAEEHNLLSFTNASVNGWVAHLSLDL